MYIMDVSLTIEFLSQSIRTENSTSRRVDQLYAYIE